MWSRLPRGAIVASLVILCCASCNEKHDDVALSAAVERALESGGAVDTRVQRDIREFYRAHPSPAWLTRRSQAKAVEALAELRQTSDHGLSAFDYDEADLTAALQEVAQPPAETRDDRIARLDVKITAALLAAGRDVALGSRAPAKNRAAGSRSNTFVRTSPDFPVLLRQAAETDITRWLESVEPPHREYAALRKALGDLRAQAGKGGWPVVPPAMFRPGHRDTAVVTLRQRLAAGGQLRDSSAADPVLYDTDVENGVRSFQELHGLPATGIADKRTIAAMNVPLRDRIRQVAVNLSRWRSMPDDLGRHHLFVNLPSFHLVAREDGKTTFRMRVIVGKVDQQTPAFSSEMTTVVFSPYWNIPDSIAEGETVPAVARDPGFLSRNKIDILRPSGAGMTAVDPSSVDWDDPSEIRRLAFRQRPGPGNALGHVKFLFPNKHNVYLHDTPGDHLFARPVRAFSHGCVRVEEPERFAQYILRDRPEWDAARIRAAMKSGVETQVRLNAAIPVHLVYFTAWVDDQGGLQFRPDIYSYDRRATSATAALQ
jgi:L,D-transpeptidase YcbB